MQATAASLRHLPDRAGRGRSPTRPRSRTGCPRAGCWPLAARLVRDVGALITGAAKAGQAARHVRHRRRGPLRLRGRPGRVRRGAGRRGHRAGRQVPRRAAPRAAGRTGSSSPCTPASPKEQLTWAASSSSRGRSSSTPRPSRSGRPSPPGPDLLLVHAPHRVEERLGGAMTREFGEGFEVTGEVHAWEPGKRILFRGDRAAARARRTTRSSSWSRAETVAGPCCASCRAAS